jgi:hypothetical protein
VGGGGALIKDNYYRYQFMSRVKENRMENIHSPPIWMGFISIASGKK